MADSLDNKANKNANPNPNGADVDNADDLKQRQNIAKDIMPELFKDVDGKDPITHKP